MMIIGLSGKKGSGKTTIRKEICRVVGQHRPIAHFAFADEIKRIAIEVMGLPAQFVHGTDEQKNTTLTSYQWESMPFKNDKKGLMTVREVLQVIGTEIFRTMDPNIWLKVMYRKIMALDKPEYWTVVIDDCRFENEIDFVRNLGGRTYKLTRFAGQTSDTHVSEATLDDSYYHLLVDNNKLNIEEAARLIIDDSDLYS